MRNPFNEGEPEKEVWDESIKSAKALLSGNAPAWLSDSAFNKSDIARRVGMTPGALNVKLSGFNYNKLTPEDLERLEVERRRLIALLEA